MSQLTKTRVFMSGRSQHVTIPAEFRFNTKQVYIRRDPETGDLILSEHPKNLADILAALDKIGVPDDFLSPEERAQTPPQEREDL
ncbi:MAG TPA: hypothetical protein VMD58_00415 [Acidobacteriaceae bacterium]|nr:hypothetical protein [Acidobacteriaceae bacterium]